MTPHDVSWRQMRFSDLQGPRDFFSFLCKGREGTYNVRCDIIKSKPRSLFEKPARHSDFVWWSDVLLRLRNDL